MEDLLKQVKASPYYSEIKKKLTESQIKDFLKDYSSQSSSGLDSEGGMTITPSKGYVVKTSDLSSSEKVFINICSHEIVDLPEQKDLPEVEDHLALRVPLSLGNPRPDHDKSKNYLRRQDLHNIRRDSQPGDPGKIAGRPDYKAAVN